MSGVSSTDLDSLRTEARTIHLLYHHNRNQHRQARWWKYFSIFHRRSLQLVSLLENSDTQSSEQTARYLVSKIVPVAYRYFHGVLAQGQFITLGLALLASLAKVRSLLLPLVEGYEKKQELRVLPAQSSENDSPISMGLDDVGMKVSRDDPVIVPAEHQSSEVLKGAASLPTAKLLDKSKPETVRKRKKDSSGSVKKKKKGNAIDDIFKMF